MGRKVTDGNAIQVQAPAATLVEKGELCRIDGFTGFAADEITTSETDRLVELDTDHGVWSIKTPAGTAGAVRGDYLGWVASLGNKFSAADLSVVVAQPAAGGVPDVAVVQVESPRNSRGYTRVKLCVY